MSPRHRKVPRPPLRTLHAIIFKPAARYPADSRAVFVLAISIVAGIGAVIAEAQPQSLEALLPTWAVVTWGVGLTIFSAVTLTGISFQSLNGVVAEFIGSVALFVLTTFYSVCAVFILGLDALQVIAFVVGWGVACGVRSAQLWVLLTSMRRQAEAAVP